MLFNCTNELLNLATKPAQLGKQFAIQISQFIAQYNMANLVTQVKELGGSVGIDAVEADANAPVEYFNLQGMPVGARQSPRRQRLHPSPGRFGNQGSGQVTTNLYP